jgi:SAM-dependent methyltransferase
MNPEEYAQLFQLGESHWWFVGTREILFSSIRHYTSRDKPILDAGCGSGLMMKRLSDTGTVFGVDNSKSALEHCHDIGFSRLCQADAEKLPFKSNTFGLTVATDIIEHCEDDETMLGELYRVATSGGMLLASVPAYNTLWSAHDVALHHMRRYSKRELIRKVEATGFKVDRVSFFNTLLFPPIAIKRLVFEKLKRDTSEHRIKYYESLRLLNQLLLAAMRIEKWYLKRASLPFGLSILLLASKE